MSSAVNGQLKAWLEENPGDGRRICLKAVLAAQAREAARKARELIKRKGALDSSGLPQKLADCATNDVERSELFKKPEPFMQVLAALKPDVLLLQELSSRNGWQDLKQLLEAHLGGTWNVLVGEAGGDLRCAVASRGPLAPFAPLRNAPSPVGTNRRLSSTGAVLAIGEQRVLAVRLPEPE